ncbi:SRPBCC family protein [Sabulilitoribacter multivorans]|uniref:SRPBCC family protein n=1 Tax=Flaviramulus multivorans TaxID=1304750 RepID=A0ABS9IGT7_9FLAO|nr:SRPBCC family protein [Flaviramulus multivorans]MCF7559969.1 SRPBCC family protein [Flaviramulus multivorans]
MKFVCHISINKPIEEVVKQFENPEALKQSQKDFVRIEHLSGNKREAGAKSKLVYKKFDLFETIIHNNLPEEFYAKYEHKNMTNTMRNTFVAVNAHETKMVTEIHYSELRGFVIKLFAKLFPGMFKKQVDKWLVKFKSFVEKQS